jgi:hypothetical protein
MIGVLLVAVVLGWMVSRIWYRPRQAQEHMRQFTALIFPINRMTGLPDGPADGAMVAKNGYRIDYHRAMAEKWRSGALHFWAPIEPDPQPPSP